MRTVRRCGADAVMVDCAGAADAVALWRRLDGDPPPGVSEVVPGAVTVLVVGAVDDRLREMLATMPGAGEVDAATGSARVVGIDVRYDGADLDAVAAASGMGVDEVVRRHQAVDYTVGFGGFAPGFAYLTGLDPALHMPRRSTPRPRVPRGAVAIADCYTGVYPADSPGGWHLLGSTDAVLFDLTADPPALLQPGMRVRFTPVR